MSYTFFKNFKLRKIYLWRQKWLRILFREILCLLITLILYTKRVCFYLWTFIHTHLVVLSINGEPDSSTTCCSFQQLSVLTRIYFSRVCYFFVTRLRESAAKSSRSHIRHFAKSWHSVGSTRPRGRVLFVTRLHESRPSKTHPWPSKIWTFTTGGRSYIRRYRSVRDTWDTKIVDGSESTRKVKLCSRERASKYILHSC